MRKLIYSMMVSLDGFIEGPNRELDWSIIDEELHTFSNEQERASGALLYGRRLYELMAGYWPTADEDPSALDFEVEYARIWKSKPKIVFSRTLDKVDWNSRLVRDNVAEEIRTLKEQPGQDLSIGGATLAATALRLGLIDEFQPIIHPVILGSGTPYLPPLEHKLNLRLVETRTFKSGVVYLRYQRA